MSLRPVILTIGLVAVVDVANWAWLLSLPEEQHFATWEEWLNRVSFVALPVLIAALVVAAAALGFGRARDGRLTQKAH